MWLALPEVSLGYDFSKQIENVPCFEADIIGVLLHSNIYLTEDNVDTQNILKRNMLYILIYC